VACEHSNERLGSIKGGKFVDQSNDYQLLKKESAPWGKTSAKFLYHDATETKFRDAKMRFLCGGERVTEECRKERRYMKCFEG
jgi:hypothetical protein